jgi:hypothetical protein
MKIISSDVRTLFITLRDESSFWTSRITFSTLRYGQLDSFAVRKLSKSRFDLHSIYWHASDLVQHEEKRSKIRDEAATYH